MYWSAKVTPGSKQKMYLMQGREHRAKWNSAVLIIKCNFSRSLLREIRNQGRGGQKSAILANSLFEWLFTPPLLFASYCPQNIPSTLCPNGRPLSKEYFVQVWSRRSKGLSIYLSFFLILRLFSKWLVSILSTFWMVIYFEKKRFWDMVFIWFLIHPWSSLNGMKIYEKFWCSIFADRESNNVIN